MQPRLNENTACSKSLYFFRAWVLNSLDRRSGGSLLRKAAAQKTTS